MLAATERLASSAIRTTCSSGRTLRQVSTAFLAPGINSGAGRPKYISQSYKNRMKIGEAQSPLPLTRKQAGHGQSACERRSNSSWADAEGGNLAPAAGDVGEAGGAQTSQKAADSSAEKIGREID